MDIVIDTSALVAVVIAKHEPNRIIEITMGSTLIRPGSIPWEVGTAFSAMFKRKSLSLEEAKKGLAIFKRIPIRYINPDFSMALKLSMQTDIYAYDAYFLDCAIRYKTPLLTLDRRLQASAHLLNIETIEV